MRKFYAANRVYNILEIKISNIRGSLKRMYTPCNPTGLIYTALSCLMRAPKILFPNFAIPKLRFMPDYTFKKLK